ncbi:hypothetical protein [Vibrio crassostreae]|uniref:hypothetical protein n=1 Tax=Vibrio crassostreae TaxID=246167 RepID=UPI00104E83F9|nr:hypothetical protein [Vibrio crassostreae]TCV12434.1 hypothetical protein EDB16_106152 [Vibrio crassostreae]TQK26190.1 hypothetical protein FB441_3635 [Vibrio crassostreae]TWD64812.1 hypothetical protein FB444_108152 [Vibrio crassostreae]
MKVLEQNQTKILETETFLREIITSPTEFKCDAELLKALTSQAGIAKYENPERNIASCSLNTLKSNSEALLERGFLALDELRINAKSAIEGVLHDKKSTKGNKQTTIGLKLKVSELEAQLDTAQRSNALLTNIVMEMRSKLKQLAMDEGAQEERQQIYRTYNLKLKAKMSYMLDGEV